MRVGVVALGVLASLAVPASAPSQTVSSTSPGVFTGNFFGGGGFTARTSTDFAVNVSGVLIISFHGDPGTGCAARGLCDYSGLVSVDLGNQGDLSVANLGRGKGLSNQATLTLGGPGSGFTLADVDRTVGGQVVGHCVDAEQAFFPSQTSSANGAIIVSPLQGGEQELMTRCAGPRYSDLGRALPRATASVKRLVRGGGRIDLGGTRAFAAGGLAGTVHSTIVIEVGRPNGSGTSETGVPVGPTTKRIRTVNEALRVISTSGQLSATVRGTSDPYECRLLDSCGLTGTFTAPLAPSHPQASLLAYGPAKRPYRDFLKALGLGSKGDARGIAVYGNITWSGGSFTETIEQGGRCSDTGPIGGGEVSFGLDKGGLAASYGITSSLRTRCPGPLLSSYDQALATGRLGVGVLRQRTFTLRLGGSRTFGDQGYSVVSGSSLSFVLRRGRVTPQVSIEPGG